MKETDLLVQLTKCLKHTTTPFDLFSGIVNGMLEMEPTLTLDSRVVEFVYQVLRNVALIEHEGNVGWRLSDVDFASMRLLSKKLAENREFVYGLRAVFGACFSQYSDDLYNLILGEYKLLSPIYRDLFMFR